MRLLEEQSRLEKRVEESERKGEEVELRLEDELCSIRSRLAAKEEVESPSSIVQASEMETCSATFSSLFQELSEAREQLEEGESRRLKQSPDTSSSFDFSSPPLSSQRLTHTLSDRAPSLLVIRFLSLFIFQVPGSITFEFSGLARARWRSTGPLLRRSLQS